jgi:cytochrome c biogenesis protein
MPVLLEGRFVLLSGMRETPAEPFRYMRLPLDEKLELDEFLRLRAGLLDAGRRAEIARRFAKTAASNDAVSQTMRERLAESAERTLETFALRVPGGGRFEARRARGEREPQRVYLRVLQGAQEAWRAMRAKDGLPALESSRATASCRTA